MTPSTALPLGRPLRAGALFAGYGGLELALHLVFGDVDLAWLAEFDAAPSRILAQRFPGVPNFGDVTAVDWAAVEPVDIITGGSPCQDLSHAGKRAGMRAGTRSGLWASMCDAIEIIRPRLVVWENVRGALSAEADSAVEPCPICVGDGRGLTLRALGRVLGDLAELGYDAAWCGLRAADVGAPHGRFRVFVLAWPADTPSTGLEAWREGRHREGGAAHVPGDPWRFGDGDHGPVAGLGGRAADLNLLRTPTAQLAVNGGSQHPDKRREGGHGPTLADEVEFLLPTPMARPDGGETATQAGGNLTLHGVVEGVSARDVQRHAAAGRRVPVEKILPTPTTQTSGYNNPANGPSLNQIDRLLPTPRATDGPKGAVSRTPATDRRVEEGRSNLAEHVLSAPFGPYTSAIGRWETVLGRPAPALTEPTGRDGAHRLSPRFVEWLMGLPAGWVTDTPTTRNEQLKALGNGVVPHQAAAALRHLLSVSATVRPSTYRPALAA